MSDRLQDLTLGFRERVDRIAIFAPLFELKRKTKTDAQGRPIDWFSLGLLGLLFFFESMLTRNRETSQEDLGRFLQTQNANGPIEADRDGFIGIAKELIDAFRDPSGQRKSLSFYDWESGKQETVSFSLLEVRDSNLRENRQFYQLSQRGLELVFATKEYFSEFQISINQLVLRKQLEKGEFNSALREVDEMRVAVEELRRKLVQLGNEVQRNIVSHETQQRYSRLLEDISKRLEREQVEFEDLEMFVRGAKEKYEYDQQGEKEQRSYRLIVKIASELNQVHHLHRTLLDESISLKRKVLFAARESLYHAGLVSFHFDQDIVSRVSASPLPPVALQGLLRPFALLEGFTGWSPMDVFEKQRIEKRGEQEEKSAEFDVFVDEVKDSYGQTQMQNFLWIAEALDEFLAGSREMKLSAFMQWLAAHSRWEPMLHHRSFYDFWLVLHQRSPFEPGQISEDSGKWDVILAVFNREETVEVVEEAAILSSFDRRYSIQEMSMRIGGKEDVQSDVSRDRR